VAERPCGRTVEQQRILLWVTRRQAPQHGRRNVEFANERSARGRPPGQSVQPAKRRKINEPLVPPKPKEFERLTSIFIFRAVFGT